MKIVVQRMRQGVLGTFGKMFVDGVEFCATLEPAPGPELIPAGTYPFKVEMSPKFGFPTPHLIDVPGHSYEEIHIGNSVKDSLGCTLVGVYDLGTSIGQSMIAFKRLMEKIAPLGMITYVDPIPQAV